MINKVILSPNMNGKRVHVDIKIPENIHKGQKNKHHRNFNDIIWQQMNKELKQEITQSHKHEKEEISIEELAHEIKAFPIELIYVRELDFRRMPLNDMTHLLGLLCTNTIGAKTAIEKMITLQDELRKNKIPSIHFSDLIRNIPEDFVTQDTEGQMEWMRDYLMTAHGSRLTAHSISIAR
ncbi:hypothetical protein ACFL56_02770 [Candidatus Margulisiibacteriota bacterium]